MADPKIAIVPLDQPGVTIDAVVDIAGLPAGRVQLTDAAFAPGNVCE
jgi:hypothetical protein